MAAANQRAYQRRYQRRWRALHGDEHRRYNREWMRRDRCIQRLAAALRLVEPTPLPEFAIV